MYFFLVMNVSVVYQEPIFVSPNSNGLTLNLHRPFNESNYTVTWTQNNQQLSSQHFTLLNNNSLRISAIMDDYYGMYTATVSNGFNWTAIIFAVDLQHAGMIH